jgi:hypothetical protein
MEELKNVSEEFNTKVQQAEKESANLKMVQLNYQV